MNAPATGQDLQRHVRTATLIPGRLLSDMLTCGCEILNLSIGGARVRLEGSPLGLDRVAIQVEGYPDLTGYVVWRAEHEIGVEFDFESRESAQALQAAIRPAQVPQDQRRTIRVSVLWSARLLSNDGTDDFPCMVLNISTEGARLRLSIPAVKFDFVDVRLHIDRLGLLAGRVAWRDADEMAIKFDEDPDQIASMLSAVLPRAQFAAFANEAAVETADH